MSSWLVVSDLDGTLLDDRYQLEEAASALTQLLDSFEQVQIALASSKTLVEMLRLGKLTDHRVFLIFENGAGVAWPEDALARRGSAHIDGYQYTRLCLGYRKICEILRAHRDMGYPFLGFADMDEVEIAERTGLSEEAAHWAKQREMTEPIVWHGDDAMLRQFEKSLVEHGLTVQLGGRFHHVSSGARKAAALDYLIAQIRYEQGTKPIVLACGDAPNDLELIDKADCAVVFPQRGGGYIRPADASIQHAAIAGPECWLQNVQQRLSA